MNKLTTLKYLVFEEKRPEELEAAIMLLISSLNELQGSSNKRYYLRTLNDKSRPIKKLYLDKMEDKSEEIRKFRSEHKTPPPLPEIGELVIRKS